MLTKDEIQNIDVHCRDNNISRAAYLREIGVSQNVYYSSRRRWFGDAVTEEACAIESENISSTNGGFVPIEFNRTPKAAISKRSRSQNKREQELAKGNTLLIEMRTPSGTELRIQGQINIKMLKEIIHASGGGAQDV